MRIKDTTANSALKFPANKSFPCKAFNKKLDVLFSVCTSIFPWYRAIYLVEKPQIFSTPYIEIMPKRVSFHFTGTIK
jgi:hypothetical protein